MVRRSSHGALQRTCGYSFRDATLLERALTHASAVGESRHEERKDNETLEFLGDRVLGVCIADIIFPYADNEKELAIFYNHLVCEASCAHVACALKMQKWIVMGKGEKKGDTVQESVLADACEALVAAIYLDGGIDAARAFVGKMWKELLDNLRHEGSEFAQDPKTRLQQWAQGLGYGLPNYATVSCCGPAHTPTFTVEVRIGQHVARATGSSHKKAQQAAAAALLVSVEDDGQ